MKYIMEEDKIEYEKVKCPYCQTVPKKQKRTRRVTCECHRLHEYKDVNGKIYFVLYTPDGTKELIYPRERKDIKIDNTLTPCTEIVRRYNEMRYNLFKEKYEKHGQTKSD